MWSQVATVDAARPYPPSDTTDFRPISFPFWMVREIALDLEEKDRLELEVQLFAMEVEHYERLLKSMEQKEQQRRQQVELLGRNSSLLEEQLRAEKQLEKGTGSLNWWLRLLGALGAGFVFGRL